MSVSDYLKNGQDVSFQVETPDISPKFLSIVEEVKNSHFIIKIIDEKFDLNNILNISDAVVLGVKAGLEYSLKVKIEKIDNNIITLEYIPSRSHLRVNSYVILNYKVITGDEFIEKRKKFIQNISHDTEDYLYQSHIFSSDEIDYKTEHTTADLVNEIKTLHKKMDYIIKLLVKSDDENIIEREHTEVNLSGSGMKFNSTDNLKTGDFLDIKMVLPMSSGIVIEFIAEVVRVIRPSDKTICGDEGLREVAVKYVAVNEDDREMIIRYTFKRQRELLRAFESNSA